MRAAAPTRCAVSWIAIAPGTRALTSWVGRRRVRAWHQRKDRQTLSVSHSPCAVKGAAAAVSFCRLRACLSRLRLSSFAWRCGFGRRCRNKRRSQAMGSGTSLHSFNFFGAHRSHFHDSRVTSVVLRRSNVPTAGLLSSEYPSVCLGRPHDRRWRRSIGRGREILARIGALPRCHPARPMQD